MVETMTPIEIGKRAREPRPCPNCGALFLNYDTHLERCQAQIDDDRCSDCRKVFKSLWQAIHYDPVAGAKVRLCSDCWEKRKHPRSEVVLLSHLSVPNGRPQR
jgi:hypothetical protein